MRVAFEQRCHICMGQVLNTLAAYRIVAGTSLFGKIGLMSDEGKGGL